MRRPNFVLFITDQQRADHLGCYGNPTLRTPHLDALASRGVRFTRFHVATPICQPNRAALVTGQMPSVNGVRQNGIPLGLDSLTFAEVLRESGYRSRCRGCGPCWPSLVVRLAQNRDIRLRPQGVAALQRGSS